MKILSVDIGFGSTKVTYLNPANTLQNNKFITALAKKNESGVFMDEDCVEVGGINYLCFDRATKVPADQQIQIRDFDSLKLATPIFIKKISKDLNLQFDYVVAGLSIAMYDKWQEYQKHICTTLNLPEDRVIVLQQGVGGWATYSTYGLDPSDTVSGGLRLNDYLLIDIGHNTLDVLSVIGGKLSEDTVGGMSGAGTTWIADRLANWIYKEHKITVTPSNARELVEKQRWTNRGKTVDLVPILSKIKNEYCKFIVNTLESAYANSMQNRQGLLFIGGTSIVIKETMERDPEIRELFKSMYGEYFINIPRDPEFYNSAGYYLIADRLANKY